MPHFGPLSPLQPLLTILPARLGQYAEILEAPRQKRLLRRPLSSLKESGPVHLRDAIASCSSSLLSDGKKFARGVKKRLPQAAYLVDAQYRANLDRGRFEVTMLFIAAATCWTWTRAHLNQCPRHSLNNRRRPTLAAICLVDLIPRPSSLNFINGCESLLPQEERPRCQKTVSKRSCAHGLRLG